MALYIYEQPAFSIEHFHPGFCRSLRSMITLPMNRQWSLMENLSEESNQSYCTSNIYFTQPLPKAYSFQNSVIDSVQLSQFSLSRPQNSQFSNSPLSISHL